MNQQRKAIYALRKQILEGRYSPELSEEDKKKGKEPPPPPETSGDWTIDSLAENIKPRVGADRRRLPRRRHREQGRHRRSLSHRRDRAAHRGQGARSGEADARALSPVRRGGRRQAGARGSRRASSTRRRATAAASLIQQRERVLDLADEIISNLVWTHCPEKAHAEDWDLDALAEAVKEAFNLPVKLDVEIARSRGASPRRSGSRSRPGSRRARPSSGRCVFFFFARHFYLEEIDAQWIDHLKSMDQLREGIGLRGYGQKDPKIEYKKEGYDMFRQMMDRISAERRRTSSSACGSSGSSRPAQARAAASSATRSCPSSSTRSAAWWRSTRRPGVSAGGRRAGGGRAGKAEDRAARAAEGRPQRAMPLRQRQEVQEVPRRYRRRVARTRTPPYHRNSTLGGHHSFALPSRDCAFAVDKRNTWRGTP